MHLDIGLQMSLITWFKVTPKKCYCDSGLLDILIKINLKSRAVNPINKYFYKLFLNTLGFELPCHIYLKYDIVLAILRQTPYPSGQNAGPTTLVYPQAPQTMNSQPQTRSPVSKQKLVLDNVFHLSLCL